MTTAEPRARAGVARYLIAGGIGLVLATTSVLPASAQISPAPASGVGDGRPSPGAPGIGDPLYPTLGNGGYDVLDYDLDLRYPTASPTVTLVGTVVITARATQSLSRFDLDFSGQSLGSVRVGERSAAFVRDGDELVITPARVIERGDTFTVTVTGFTSTATVPDPNSFLTTVFVASPDGSVWAGQPNGSHQIFPCNDHPLDKATFSYRIDVPAGSTAVANGELVGKVTKAGRTVYRYRMNEPQATELAQVAVGDFTVTSRGTHEGTLVRDVTPTRLTAALAPQLAVETSQLDWMERKVGSYPFRSYGSLVVQANLGFALETQTLSLYDSTFFTDYPQGVWDPVMLHELAHQWFGDSVAPARWSDVWQNEGHATWYEFTYAAEKGQLLDDAGIADFTQLMKTIYGLGDIWRSQLGPVGQPLSGDVNDLFNINVYYGGALVLYALQQKIGVAAFDRVERAWVTRNRGESASTADFIALATRVSGRNLTAFLNDWIYGTTTPAMPGHPDWTVLPVTPATAARTANGGVPMNGLTAPALLGRRH